MGNAGVLDMLGYRSFYGRSLEEGFCTNCVLFSKNKSVTGQLFMYLMTNLTRAKQILQKHSLQ